MKAVRYFLLVLIPLLIGTSVKAQMCCQMPSTNAIPAMFRSAEFLREHLAPMPIAYTPPQGASMAEFATESGSNGHAYLLPDPEATATLVIFHEWWGLNDYIKREAESWQKKLGHVKVIAVDLFDGKVATTPEEAQKYVGAATPERAMQIIQGALKMLAPTGPIVTLGWCYGGGWALQASLAAKERTVGTVMYYGMPELDPQKLQALHGPVIEFFGSKDKFIDQTKSVEFEHAMKKAHKHLETKTYNANHAFANPSNPIYDKAAAADANKRALAFLKKALKQKKS